MHPLIVEFNQLLAALEKERPQATRSRAGTFFENIEKSPSVAAEEKAQENLEEFILKNADELKKILTEDAKTRPRSPTLYNDVFYDPKYMTTDDKLDLIENVLETNKERLTKA